MTGKALAALALAGLTAACSGSGYGSSKSAGAPSPTVTGTPVHVKETEYSITLDRSSFTPGVYSFLISDTGHATHALEIDGPGVSGQRSSYLQGGGSTTLTVTLQAGTYRLFCPVANHADKGMDTTITVA